MDSIVFLSGYLAGSVAGAITGMLIWLIYGTLNPYGFNLPILLSTMLAESLYGVIGGFIARKKVVEGCSHYYVYLGGVGFLSTMLYDLLTNLVFAAVFSIPYLKALIIGIPFMVVHISSNFFLFPLVIGVYRRISPAKSTFLHGLSVS